MVFDILSGKISGNRVCLLEEIVWFINQMVAIKFYSCHSHTRTPVRKRSQRFFFQLGHLENVYVMRYSSIAVFLPLFAYFFSSMNMKERIKRKRNWLNALSFIETLSFGCSKLAHTLNEVQRPCFNLHALHSILNGSVSFVTLNSMYDHCHAIPNERTWGALSQLMHNCNKELH